MGYKWVTNSISKHDNTLITCIVVFWYWICNPFWCVSKSRIWSDKNNYFINIDGNTSQENAVGAMAANTLVHTNIKQSIRFYTDLSKVIEEVLRRTTHWRIVCLTQIPLTISTTKQFLAIRVAENCPQNITQSIIHHSSTNKVLRELSGTRLSRSHQIGHRWVYQLALFIGLIRREPFRNWFTTDSARLHHVTL